MDIVGSGLIASGLRAYADKHAKTVAFASGVSDSSLIDRLPFEREFALLGNVLERVREENRRVVYFSGGGAIYGRWGSPAKESDALEPKTPYGLHQLACETIIREAGVPFVLLRLPNVVGSRGNAQQLVPSLVRQALSGRVDVQMNATRDLIDVDDIGGIICDVLSATSDDVTLNIASGHSIGAPEIVDEICSVLGVQPIRTAHAVGESQRFSTDRLTAILGYDPFPNGDRYRHILRKHVPELALAVTKQVG